MESSGGGKHLTLFSCLLRIGILDKDLLWYVFCASVDGREEGDSCEVFVVSVRDISCGVVRDERTGS